MSDETYPSRINAWLVLVLAGTIGIVSGHHGS